MNDEGRRNEGRKQNSEGKQGLHSVASRSDGQHRGAWSAAPCREKGDKGLASLPWLPSIKSTTVANQRLARSEAVKRSQNLS
jgi:hypothetical protein